MQRQTQILLVILTKTSINKNGVNILLNGYQ
jgi:hypothetical protein